MPAPEHTGSPWRRADGQVRMLFHFDSGPAAEPALTWPERAGDWLEVHLPGWNDHLGLVGAGLFALLLGVLVALL
jgi:hypothetical protein